MGAGSRAQTSLEYLLLIAGVILLVVLVFVFSKSFVERGGQSAAESASAIANAVKTFNNS